MSTSTPPERSNPQKKQTHAPVVPELNKIHNGQSNDNLAHSISPSAVRPNFFSLPNFTNSSNVLHPSLPVVEVGASGWLMRTTFGEIPARDFRPSRRAVSFGMWGWTFALYLRFRRTKIQYLALLQYHKEENEGWGLHNSIDREYQTWLDLFEPTNSKMP